MKEKKFLPYMEVAHGGAQGLALFKQHNHYLYLKELWYYSESFYIKRDQLAEGAELNEAIIDIARFESYRKDFDEAIVPLPGFKDQLILLPTSKLIYRPDNKR